MVTSHPLQHEMRLARVQAYLRHHPQTRHLAITVSWHETAGRIQLDGPVPRCRDRGIVERVARLADNLRPVLNHTYVITDGEGREAWEYACPPQAGGLSLAA